MALHLTVDVSRHGFVLDVMRGKLRSWRRIAWRNSALRQSLAGHCHHERIWWRGWDISLHWGQYDPSKPSEFYNPKEKKWLPKGS